MLSALITSAARRKLLVRFLTHPGERFYASQLIRELDIASSAAQKELARLQGAGLLISEREGNARFYRANTEHPVYSELKNIVYKTEGFGDCIRKQLERLDGVKAAVIYGSVAKGSEGVGSDIDLLVLGDVLPSDLDEAVARAEELIDREVNATVLSVAEWRDRLNRRQAFASDIMAGSKIFILGGEDDLR